MRLVSRLAVLSCVAVTAATMLTACGGGDDAATDEPAAVAWPPVPEEPALAAGFQIWSADCRLCHLRGAQGSPPLGDRAAWAERIAKGTDVLYKHAIEGWLAPSMAEMPARGGNDDLSDAQVQSAVDYMIWAATEGPEKP